MAISDISAYFENIQIPILRDQLLTTLNKEPKIVNLLISFLEAWAVKTSDGRSQWRGIPQSNAVSSFLGNVFLMALDEDFEKFCRENEAEYYRYMDDVRIFTKKENEARQAILLLDRTLKSRHLNVQSAKTKVLKEKDHEISNDLINKRLDELNAIMKKVAKGKTITKEEKEQFIKKINDLAKKNFRPGSQKIISSSKRKPFTDTLDSRFFRRWVSAHLLVGSPYCLDRLIFEIENNPDPRITKLALRANKRFPRHKVFSSKLFKFIKSNLNIFSHQEAELIKSFRYLSEIPDKIIEYCKQKAFNPDAHFYVRIQALNLLSRIELSEDEYKELYELFENELNQEVQVSMAGNIIKHKNNHSEILKTLVLHPNEKVRKVGKYFRAIKWDKTVAINKLNFLFSKNYNISARLCDDMPILYLLTYIELNSELKGIRKKLVMHLKEVKDGTSHIGHRPILNKLFAEITKAEGAGGTNNMEDY